MNLNDNQEINEIVTRHIEERFDLQRFVDTAPEYEDLIREVEDVLNEIPPGENFIIRVAAAALVRGTLIGMLDSELSNKAISFQKDVFGDLVN